MARFLVLYRSTMSAGEQMASSTPEEAKASMDAWAAWGAAAGDALVDFGAPTTPVSPADAGPEGPVAGYSIMQSGDVESLNVLLADHPHRLMGTIEVLQMMDMPEM